jgi:tetratricopeptide (TPR) repeat protein
MPKTRLVWVTSAMVFFVLSGSVILQRCKPNETEIVDGQNYNNEFVGDESCKTCHTTEYNDWLQSDHFLAMQPPNDSTVKGDFDNVTFTSDGVTSRFFKKDKKFIINTEGDDGLNHDYEVKFIFGFNPLQQYLVEFPGGRMQVPRVSWDSKKKKWFHQYPKNNIGPKDWLHWTGNSQNWNTMCASCHSTNLRKNYNIGSDNYNTTYSVINVSCESCHGAGKLHIDYINSGKYRSGQKIHGSLLELGSGSDQLSQVNTCALCHALKTDLGGNPVITKEIMDNYIPDIPSTEHFHADGQIDDESYIYTSFLQSKMFHRKVKCSNCHNPHSGKTVLPGNQLCGQCHGKAYDAPSHTFHPGNIVASECKSCHMPGKIYMGNDFRHDHSFRVPRPDLSVKYGTPNACNNCHNDRSSQWAAEAITKWYGPKRKYHFADDLIPGSKPGQESEAYLLKLLSDTSVPDIVKATAASYIGNNTSGSSKALLTSLAAKDAQVRYRALRSLSTFPPLEWQHAVLPLLADKAKAVRIAAAELLITIPSQEIPAQYRQVLTSARYELQIYLENQADFAVGNLMLADHYLRLKDYNEAEKFYLRGLKKDSMMNYARLNLSTVYNLQGRNSEAFSTLEAAAKIDPKNDRIWYNMALLYNEMNDKKGAERSFARAVSLKTSNPKVYYNYGLLLNGEKKFREAEKILLQGIGIDPGSAELYYALTFLYLSSNNMNKAQQAGRILKQLDPTNLKYGELFRNLSI